ncbi:helix-turn-helix domain-containing protein [Clostridium sp. 'deep sea']|uniref:helix-turn-helix domain-containing protein n=1 Tax=Clostridium sp. 'deep sea' TaxID=2779445 RepID=UPI0018965078|nr:helix-turn-helix domain-containing protein [Clostridium sp. 'deep sea']QOR36046.1 helix-turn-helix domain-containing protein [Clostridium sp. 'deep sea']
MEWITKMKVAINYIENNILDNINLSELSKILCCSEYEFQRFFSFIIGISLYEYIMKRRLSLAGYDVQNSNEKIIDIATKYCYKSHSSFTRAFKEFHGVTPSYVRNSEKIKLNVYPHFTFLLSFGGLNTMEHRIIELPATKMARSGDKDIWEFGKWWPTIAAQEKGLLFPKDFWWNNEKTGRPEWLYAIPEGLTDTNGYEVFDFPGGLYAVTTTYDEDEEKTKAYHSLKKWIEQSDCFELANENNDPTYHNRYGMGHVSSPKGFIRHQFTIFIPIINKM